METGFLNFHDEEHFSTMAPSSLYDQSDMLEDSEGSLLDMIPEGFARYSSSDAWDAEQELNGDFATMPGPITMGTKPHSKEDFHQMLNEWQEHLGSMQASDSEEIYDGIEPMTTDMPGLDIYDESSFDGDNINKKLDKTQTNKSKANGKKVVGKDLPLGHFVHDEEADAADELMGAAAAAAAQAGNMAEDSVDDDAFRIDVEDDCIDVETVNEQIPVLEAVDVSSLLEQFEATETVNSNTSNTVGATSLDSHLFAMATQKLNRQYSTLTKPTAAMSHQNIIDALPKEVIERIKASGRKKAIPVIPAMPSKRAGRGGTRMQDAAAALGRNKLLKLVSSTSSTGESIQLDHDYCTATTTSSAAASPEVAPPPARSFYHSDASEYVRDERPNAPAASEKVYSRLPDYYVVLGSLVTAKKDSRKDSGLESGDLSDASSEGSAHSAKPLGRPHPSRVVMRGSSDVGNVNGVQCRSAVQPKNGGSTPMATTTSDKIVTINGKAISFGTLMQKVNKTLESSRVDMSASAVESVDSAKIMKNKEKPMVSVLKRNSVLDEVLVRDVADRVQQEGMTETTTVKVEPKKRKLNLLEYRSRVKVLGRSRDSRENSRAVTPDPQAVEEAMQEFDQHTEIMINKDGRIDEESLATLSKTLEKKAATIKTPSLGSQHETTHWPRLITLTKECNETKVRAEEIFHRDACMSSAGQIKEEKGASEACVDQLGLNVVARLAQQAQTPERQRNVLLMKTQVKLETPGRLVKNEKTSSDCHMISPSSTRNEADVRTLSHARRVKLEPTLDTGAAERTLTNLDAIAPCSDQLHPVVGLYPSKMQPCFVPISETVVAPRPDKVQSVVAPCPNEIQSVGPLSHTVVVSPLNKVRPVVPPPVAPHPNEIQRVTASLINKTQAVAIEQAETNGTVMALDDDDVCSMSSDEVVVVDVGVDIVQPMTVDVCSSESVIVEEIPVVVVAELSGRDHGKAQEHNRDQCNSNAGANRDRSRRQYRSRRTTSSSSSSSSNSRSSRRKFTEQPTPRSRRKSRSRSPSTSSNYSSQSRSSSQSKSRSWRASRYDCNRNRRSGSNHSQNSQHSRSSYRSRRSCRSRSPVKRGAEYQLTEREKERQVEERRVIYVGRIDEGMTKAEMRNMFETFGPIVDISVHFREHGDNYGFVTFAYKVDAYAAVEQGKNDPVLGQFDLSFGGRRAFCKTRYADLDGSRMDPDEYSYAPQRPRLRPPSSGVNFDDLLREALRSKKEVSKTKV